MARRALFMLLVLIGCDSSTGGQMGCSGTNSGVLGGGSGVAGDGNAVGAGGTAGGVGGAAVGVGGVAGGWAGTGGSGSCTGTPACGPGGPGGGGARGGSGGAGGGAGQGGLGGHGNESCSSLGMLCLGASAWCCGGLTCQEGVCLPPFNADGGTCSETDRFYCLLGSCYSDLAIGAICVDGAWACPAGTVDSRGCRGCTLDSGVCGDGGSVSPDAADAETLTYVAHIQPILRSTCGSCHATGSPPGTAASVPFVDSYAVTQRLSMSADFYGCPGESVGACINRAAQIQAVEGSRCRTFDRPFHRDGFDRCITDAERALISAWVAGGMIER